MSNCNTYPTAASARTATTKPASEVEPEALEIYEAATALSCAKRTVRRMCLRHELPHFHIGTRGDYRIIRPPEGMSWDTWKLKAQREAWRCTRCEAMPPEPPRSHWRRAKPDTSGAAA